MAELLFGGGGGGIAAYKVDGFSIKSLDSTFSDERRPNFTRKCKECNMQYIFITRQLFWSPWGIKALSLHCLCTSSLTLNERLDMKAKSFVWTLSDMGLNQSLI